MVAPHTIRSVVRAIIPCAGQVLVARLKGAHAFLPGGGIEPGETAHAALRRELREELGLGRCRIGRFLGVTETIVRDGAGGSDHALAVLFEVRAPGLRVDIPPPAREPHLEFFCVRPTVEALRGAGVLPPELQTALPRVMAGGRPVWLSHVDDSEA